jgi:hypothetical protein
VCLPAPHKRLLVSPLAAAQQSGDGPPRSTRTRADNVVLGVLVVGFINAVLVCKSLFGPGGALLALGLIMLMVVMLLWE